MEIHVLKHYKKRSYDAIIQDNTTLYRGAWGTLPIRSELIRIDLFIARNWCYSTSQEQTYNVAFIRYNTSKQINIECICALSERCFNAIAIIDNKKDTDVRHIAEAIFCDIDYYYKNVTAKELYDIWKALSEVKLKKKVERVVEAT